VMHHRNRLASRTAMTQRARVGGYFIALRIHRAGS
jgi:hypothetical protein